MEKPIIYISKAYFTTVFNQHIQKGERLELIKSQDNYILRGYMRFKMIDWRGPRCDYPDGIPTVTIDFDQIEKYLKIQNNEK